MNKFITLLAAAGLAYSASAQITINATDTGMTPGNGRVFAANFTQFAPARGTTQTWKFDTCTLYSGNGSTFVDGVGPQPFPIFIAAGATYNIGFQSDNMIKFNTAALYRTVALGPISYPVEYPVKVTSTGLDIIGGYKGNFGTIPLAGFGSFTSADTAYATADSFLISTPSNWLKYPMTAGSTWSSTAGRFVFNWSFKVPSVSSSIVPLQHVYHMVRTDSVIGWGTMRVKKYGAGVRNGTTIAYSVLMERSLAYHIDSFYSGGTPLAASSALLTALGVTQGMHTDSVAQTIFYRKNRFLPLMRMVHLAPIFTASALTYFDSSVTFDATAVPELGINDVATVLYPNPATNEVNMMVTGRNISEVAYSIIDFAGRTVQSGQAELNGNTAKVVFNSSLAAGSYVIYMADKKNGFEAREEFTIAK